MEQFLNKIRSNAWPVEFRIPPERELCEQYQVSRITVRKALDELERAGYIYRKQGKGTFVKPKAIDQKLSKFYTFKEELHKRGISETAQMLSFRTVNADERIAEALNIPANQMVYKIKRLRLMDDEPYGVEESYIPLAIVPDLTSNEVETLGLYNALRKHNVHPVRAIERFRAVTLNSNTARLLKDYQGEAAVCLTRTTYEHVQTIEFCESYIRGSRFEYTIELN
jgi:GntR family transcriptional regulator